MAKQKVAKSVGTAKAKRDAVLAKKRGMSASAKPSPAKIDAEMARTKKQVRVYVTWTTMRARMSRVLACSVCA